MTSDLHFFHNKKFLYEPRGCKTPEEHTEMIINGINEQANEHSLIINLGDFCLTCSYEDMLDAIIKIKCRNIWSIIGNHDTRILKLMDRLTDYAKWNSYYDDIKSLTDPSVDLSDKEKWIYYNKSLINLGKFKEIVIQEPSDEVGVKDKKHHVTLAHYPLLIWNKSHHGTISLCGHSHGTLYESSLEQVDSKRLDVGVDNALAYNGNVMFDWNSIKKIMSFKGINVVDHHNKTTT